MAAEVLIAMVSSVDNMSFGVAYALKGVTIGPRCSGIVAAINSAGMLGTMLAGAWVVRTLPRSLGSPERVGAVLAGSVFLLIGLWELVQILLRATRRRKTLQNSSDADDATSPTSRTETRRTDDRELEDRVDVDDEDRVDVDYDDEEPSDDGSTDRVVSPDDFSPKPPVPVLLWTDREGNLPRGPEDDVEAPRGQQQQQQQQPPKELGIGTRPSIVRNFVVLAGCCGYDVVEERSTRRPALEEARFMRYQEALFLGVALTVTNVAAGLAAGASGLNVTVTVVATFIASFLFMLIGQQLGRGLRHGATAYCRFTHHDVSAVAAAFFLTYGIIVLVDA
eukprot:CAMPEP_0118909762 /NCGR_PEP_ID=MMETSP1166-20130328/12205_1 /TAXON_ID=1104430 /ORGANISM="Chrysoreinhardia sp, Strain CCMP3193" /LENGTH=335 /DNA_ID=CAMNT_0006849211 /DNA_START=85 /DNA_END=1092 /DNA_ORIENTATION=-